MKFKLILSLLAVTILSACSCEPYEEEARSGQKQEKAAISASGCNGDDKTPQVVMAANSESCLRFGHDKRPLNSTKQARCFFMRPTSLGQPNMPVKKRNVPASE